MFPAAFLSQLCVAAIRLLIAPWRCSGRADKGWPANRFAGLHRDLLWVHEQQLDFAPGSLVAVHAGLLATKPLAPQMDALRRRDAAAKVIQENEIGRFEALSGRKEVERMHPDLDGLALLVSGHHGKVSIHGDRFIVDHSGGNVGEKWHVEAAVFRRPGLSAPSRTIVSTGPISVRTAGSD